MSVHRVRMGEQEGEREREFESVCEGERERVNITRTRDPKTKQVPKREEAVGRRKSVT